VEAIFLGFDRPEIVGLGVGVGEGAFHGSWLVGCSVAGWLVETFLRDKTFLRDRLKAKNK
jgi:hypothetical protein